jgi:hypothetical protein
MDIPFYPELSPQNLILFDDGTSLSIPAAAIPDLIPKPIVNATNTVHLLPTFLLVGYKITLKQDGQYHKGFLSQSSNGVYRFSYKSHDNKKHKDWDVALPTLTTT